MTAVRLKGRNKMHAQKCMVGALKFDSKAEARRWVELERLARAGFILNLQRQVVFVLAPGVKYKGAKRATPALRYVADFMYKDASTGARIVEDVKGMRTQAYKIKRHLMLALLGIDVHETR